MPEILNDFLVRQNSGFYCRYGDFYIDPLLPVPRAVISHGHGDHATPGHSVNFCTAPTEAIMSYRYSKVHLHQFSVHAYDQPFEIGGVRLRFIPAGHMLGSAQILMEFQGVRYLYSGDIKLQEDATCEPLHFVKADVLITESTFADPQVIHPDPVGEIQKLNSVQQNIMLGTYSLGKAQRLTRLITQYCPSKDLLIHRGILPFHHLYKSFGFDPGSFAPYNRKDMKAVPPNKIYLVPPMTFRSYLRAKNVVRAFASGWKHLQQNNALSVLISDHVDWPDLMRYIDSVSPKELWTVHGEGKHLKQYFQGHIPVKTID